MTLDTLSIAEKLFHDFLASHGHPLDSAINHDSSKFHYYKCSLGSSTDARYKFHSDGIPSGYFKCWKCQIEINFCSKQRHEVSPQEWQDHVERMAECKRQTKHEAQQKHAEAATLAKAVFGIASEESVSDHGYLRLKRVKSYGLRILANEDENTKKAKCYKGTLLVPCYSINDQLVNLERIYFSKKENKYLKRPLRGGQRISAYSLIGEVINQQDVILIAEGYSSAATAYEATNYPTAITFNCGNIPYVTKILREKYPQSQLIIIADDDKWHDDPKLKHAGLKAAKKACASVKNSTYLPPDFGALELSKEKLAELKPTDINDLFVQLLAKGLDRTAALDIVRQQIQQNSIQRNNNMNDNPTQKEILIAEINRLASIDKVEYELTREEIANNFKIRVTELDKFVYEKQRQTEEVKSETVLFPIIEPWPDKVSLSVLLDEIVEILKRYVSFNSEHEPRAIALWVIHTYCIEAAYITPTLFVTSAEMRSGKSTLLAILQKIIFKSLAASSISPSVIYRIMPKHHPSLICDEADTYMTENNEDLRGILNAGHSRDTSGVLRTNPDTLEVEKFDAFGAKCLAAINSLPGTVEDRSIIIKMRRKAKKQTTAKLRLFNEQLRKEFHDIQRKCVKFADDNIEAIKKIDPSLPDKLNDRAADNWYSLFQIAEFADKKWLEHASKAALSLSGIEQESKSLGIELLEDILNLFDGIFKNDSTITTAELIGSLCADEEAPWATYNSKRQDTKITPRQLANLLAPYGIKSINNIGVDKRKGYSKADFQDAFSRYIHTEGPDFANLSALSAQPNNHGASMENEEKKSSASIRYNRYPLPKHDTLSQLKVADSGNSGSEQKELTTEKTLEAPSNLAGADRADKNGKRGVHDYIDV